MKRSRVLLGAAVFVVGGAMYLFSGSGDIVSRASDASLYISYRDGTAFYRQYQGELSADEKLLRALVFEGTTPFLRGEGRRDPADPFGKILGNEFRALGVFSSRAPQVSSGRLGYAIADKYQAFLEDPWDDLMLRVLYCDAYGFSEDDFRAIGSLRPDGGYADTHKLLALILLRENGCGDPESLAGVIDQGSKIIAAAASKEPEWSDLLAERVTFLFWAGRGDLVKREWIDAIKKAQQPDGGWADPAFGETSNPHSTGLSMLSLRYFIEGEEGSRFSFPLSSGKIVGEKDF